MAAPSHLLRAALVRWLLGIVTLAALLCIAAGTLRYWQAWAYLGGLFLPMSVMLAYFLRHDPALLERRMKTKESAPEQRMAMAVSAVSILGELVVAGLDRRFGWSQVPVPVVLLGLALVLVGYGSFFFVLRENSFASRVVEVQEGQQVISTGPYAMVRHPMYVAAIVMYLATPLALGSWWALVPATLLLPGMVLRILDEEKQLREQLPGYPEYCEEVRHRLVPGVW